MTNEPINEKQIVEFIPLPAFITDCEGILIASNEGCDFIPVNLSKEVISLGNIFGEKAARSIIQQAVQFNTFEGTVCSIHSFYPKEMTLLIKVSEINNKKRLLIVIVKENERTDLNPIMKQEVLDESLVRSIDSNFVMYQSLIYNSPTSVVIVNKKGEILEMNQSFRELFHMEHWTIGERLVDYSIFKSSNIDRFIQNGLTGLSVSNQEETYGLENGEYITVNMTLSPVIGNEKFSREAVGLIFHNMTKQKIIENQLVSVKLELENTLKLQKTITFKFEKRDGAFYVNMATGELLNKLHLQSEEMIGHSLEQLFGDPYVNRIRQYLDTAWDDGNEVVFENEFSNFQYIASVVPGPKQEKKEIICTLTDITKLKETENKLIEKEQKYKSLVKYSPDHIFVMDCKGFITEVNPNVEKNIKLNTKQIVGHSFVEFIPEDQVNLALEHFQMALNGKSNRYLAEIINTDFTKNSFLFTYVPIFIHGKIKGVYGIGRDMTEITQIQDELKETKELFESFFQHSGDATCLLDTKGNVIRVNRMFTKLFGWKEPEIIGENIQLIHSEESRKEFFHLNKLVISGHHIKNFETVRMKKDQKPVFVNMNISPIMNAKGEVIGMSSITRDLSDKKKTEDLLKKSEQLAMIGQLAAGVAHEIRNPLTTIKGFMQLIQENDQQNPHIELLLNELDRIELITSEFIALAKPQVTNYKRVTLNDLIKSSVEFIGMECTKLGIEVRLKLERKVLLNGDANQLKQVFLNVMKNALDAMPNGGYLEVSLKVVGQRAIISIIDNGYGIPPERLKFLGEPFYSTKEKGTGLGLMMCQKIMKEHQGTLKIESVEREGTMIDLIFPLDDTNLYED